MKLYHLRFFFDYGSETCLWAANEAAQEKFGYPVSLRELPLSLDLIATLERMIAQYDTSLDWGDPAGPSLWNQTQWRRFNEEVEYILPRLQEALSGEYLIVNEHTPG